MPRTARLSLPGGVFHIISRFARNERWLDEAGARQAYLGALARATEKYDTEILAYCLMSNHVHLVVIQGQEPTSRLTKSVHTSFAAWLRKQQGSKRSQGSVFAERPKQLLVDQDEYLLELVRYVHNNPVRAKVTRFARSSKWSSHQAYIGKVKPPDWLRMGYVLGQFAKNRTRAMQKFDVFVDEVRSEQTRDFSGWSSPTASRVARQSAGDGHRITDGVLGNPEFVNRVFKDIKKVHSALSRRGEETRTKKARDVSAQDVIDAVLSVAETTPEEFVARPRTAEAVHVKRLSIWVWVREFGGQQIEMARALGINTGAVSRHYAVAVHQAAEFDEVGSAVVSLLNTTAKKSARRRRAKGAKPELEKPRYFVDIEEA